MQHAYILFCNVCIPVPPPINLKATEMLLKVALNLITRTLLDKYNCCKWNAYIIYRLKRLFLLLILVKRALTTKVTYIIMAIGFVYWLLRGNELDDDSTTVYCIPVKATFAQCLTVGLEIKCFNSLHHMT